MTSERQSDTSYSSTESKNMTAPIEPNLDHEYDLRAAFPDYDVYFEKWRAKSRKARESLSCSIDVPYGTGPRDRVDFFPSRSPAPSPLLIYIHGGYWRSLDKSDFSFLAPPYVGRDVSLALINYDLFPGTTMTKVVEQVRGACRWVANNAETLGAEYNAVHLAGWSAGAHLAAMVLCGTGGAWAGHKLRPSSLLAISGVYDLAPIMQTSANVDLVLDGDQVKPNSPIHLTPPHQPSCPIKLVWGADETAAFHSQSASLARTWRMKGIEVTTLKAPGVHHYAVMDALADENSEVFRASADLLKLT